MGTHEAVGLRARAHSSTRPGAGPGRAAADPAQLRLTDWPVARRLFAVIMAALLMGLVFGGLRVAAAEDSAAQFGRTEQLARLSAELLPVINDLQSEQDATLVALITTQQGNLSQLHAKTNDDLGPVRAALQQVVNGSGYPATVTAAADSVANALAPASISRLQHLFDTATPSGDVVSPDYGGVIASIITLQNQVALGVTDPTLTADVQTLTALSQAKNLTAQQQAALDQSLANTPDSANGGYGFLDFGTETALQVAYVEEFNQEAAFQSSATPAEAALYDSLLGPEAAKLAGEERSDNIEQALFAVAGGQEAMTKQPILTADGISYPRFIQGQPLDPQATHPTTAAQDGITTTPALKQAWDQGVNAKLAAMQRTEKLVASDSVARASQLLGSAQRAALAYIIITAAVLLLVLGAAVLVARSLVRPLNRLREGALQIASVQLPERVRLLAASPESAVTEVVPIDVTSHDEIGQVARAFDQVHSEAVRLAGEQALLRSSFNAMFVNLSRRSQSLIERLARMIDHLEQNEDDPTRLGSLFSMDHLVTRMRRNSENLLLLAGHENPRKWSRAVALADVVRAATSEIEQYHRVGLNIAPGLALTGKAVSDVVHLLAELIENATLYSPKDTQVQVAMQQLPGGVLIEITDRGIGISEARLADMNRRLDDPPAIDVSVSRHMGLFAVAQLAKRHQVRVRLRAAAPQGVSALVWLPGDVLERDPDYLAGGGGRPGPAATQPAPVRERAAVTPGPRPGVTVSDTPRSAQAASRWFRGGLSGGLSADVQAADPGPDPDPPQAADVTAAGLPVRVPRASQHPAETAARPAPRPRANGASPGGTASLSPERARSRLSGFQRGTRRAEERGTSRATQPSERAEQ